MAPIWIVVADEGRARILELRKPGADLEEVTDEIDRDLLQPRPPDTDAAFFPTRRAASNGMMRR